MCGIVGILSKDKSIHIEACNAMISHRGPDSNGLFRDGNLAFGHQRLSILDLSEQGHQPMQTEDGSLTMIFNGEIYNHQEIRDSLKGDYPFKSSSDTQTILYAFYEMGDELWRLVFVNNGVKLTIDGAEALEALKSFEAKGLKILVCGTCLAHFDLLERKEVGETTKAWFWQIAMQASPAADASLAALAQVDQRAALAGLQVPVLVFMGDADGVVAPDIGRYAAELAAEGRLVSLPGCGHVPFLEDPESYHGELLRFLEEVSHE